KPVFLPFVHTVTKYLADFTEPPASLTVGQVIPAPRKNPVRGGVAGRGGTIAVAPSGARVSVDSEDGALELTEQGFYDVRTHEAGAARRGDWRRLRRGGVGRLGDRAAVDALHARVDPALPDPDGHGRCPPRLPVHRQAASSQRLRRAGRALSRGA